MEAEIINVSMHEARLGVEIRAVRLGQNRSQSDVAKSAGVALNAVRALEAGHGARVATLVSVLGALDRLDWINEIGAKEAPAQMGQKSPAARQRSGRSRPPKNPALTPGWASQNGWFSHEQVKAAELKWPMESENEFAI